MKTILKVPIAVVLFFVVAIGLTIYLVTQTTLPHSIVNRFLIGYVESHYDVHVSFGDIQGSLWRDLHIENIAIDFEAAPHRYRLVKIGRLSAYYDLKKLIRGKWVIDSLIVDEPLVVLRTDETGKLLLPGISGGGSGDGSSRAISVEVDRLRLVDGRFQFFKLPNTHFVDSINLVADAGYNDGLLHFNVDSASLVYPQRDFRLRNVRAYGALSDGALGIDTVEIETGTSTLHGGGVYPLDRATPFSFRFVRSHLSLDEVAALAGIKISGEADFDADLTGSFDHFGGQARLDGTLFDRRLGPLTTGYSYGDGVLSFTNLRGGAFDGTVSGNLRLDLITRPETFNANLSVHGLNLDKIVPSTFHSRLNGALLISGSGLGENSFNLDLQGAFARGSFDFVNFDSLYGMISLNVSDLYFHPGFTLLYKHSKFTAEGGVDYNGDMLLDGEFSTSQLADFWGDLFIEELSGGAHADFNVSGPNLDPDIKGRFYGDSCSFYGFSTDSLGADFDIKSFLYGRRGKVDLHAFASNVWNLPAESVAVQVDIDSNQLVIPQARLFGNRYALGASGKGVLHDSTTSMFVQDCWFRFDSLLYRSTAPARVEFLADRIIVDGLRVAGEGGSAQIYCDYGYDSTISLDAVVDTLPIAPWLSALALDSTLTGRLSMSGRMTGRLNDPTAVITGAIDSLTYRGAPVGRVAGGLSLVDSLLEVNDLRLNYEQSRTTLSGSIPLVMDLDSGLVEAPEKDMSFKLLSEGNNLNLVSLSLEDLESLTGDYRLELEIYGTLQHPQSRGEATLTNGTAKLYEMENSIEEINASIRSEDRKIYVDWVEGKARYKGKTGNLAATGEIEILSRDLFDYDLEIRGTNVPIKYDLGDVYARCDIDVLEITGSDPPVASGNVIVREAEYFDEFEEETLLAAREAADTISYMDYVINVEFLPASVRVRNSDVNLVLDGQLTVIREQAKDNYLGVLNVVRGNYYLFDMTFEIEAGSQIIFDDIENPNPALSVNVYTDIRSYAQGTGVGYNRLNLVIGGTLLQPSITAAEGTGYSDEDILSLLLWNSPASASTSDAFGSTPLEQRVYDYLGRNISQKLTRSLGVERFEIAPSYGQDSQIAGAEISLGFYTAPNLYTYFTSPLAFGQSAELGFEYRIGRNFYLRGNRDREKLYHLNLNLNWDFK